MWGTNLRQRLRLAPLFGATLLADAIAPFMRSPPRADARWGEGVSIVVPERDAPDMLASALASIEAALQPVGGASQIVVVANGAPPDRYADVARRFSRVEWIHSEAPLGFAAAVERGVAAARHGAVYLANNDVTLDANALVRVMALRHDGVFAIGSQILQQSADGRREETGFTDWYVDASGVRLMHAPPPPGDARPSLCASGGAALFNTALLRRYLPASRAYDPFYWEDVEWSVRAWRDGFRVLYCDGSVVAHRHRATTTRFYAPDELARLVERNRILFDLRHDASASSPAVQLARVCDLPYASQRELASLRVAAGVLRSRIASRRAPQPLPAPRLADPGREASIGSSYSFRLRSFDEQRMRRRVLFVTPFAVFPPRHGGARRVAAFLREHKAHCDVALLGDEASLYDARSLADFDGLCDVRLVQREDDAREQAAAGLAERMRRHCHGRLVCALERALRDIAPDVVVVEHAELAPLVRGRTGTARWILDLHDAYGGHDFADAEAARAFAADLAAYDGVTVCSEEDRALVAHRRVVCLPNGADVDAVAYQPSTSCELLFVGPFRYEPNRAGIERFLRDAWPAVRAAVPAATLTILGGDESVGVAQQEAAFAQPGVQVLGHRDDVPQRLSACALAINPLQAIRGSALKLVEALAAGRVCVTTREGARGLATVPARGLVVVEDVPSMAAPIIALLGDADRRRALEATSPGALDGFAWRHVAARQRALFEPAS